MTITTQIVTQTATPFYVYTTGPLARISATAPAHGVLQPTPSAAGGLASDVDYTPTPGYAGGDYFVVSQPNASTLYLVTDAAGGAPAGFTPAIAVGEKDVVDGKLDEVFYSFTRTGDLAVSSDFDVTVAGAGTSPAALSQFQNYLLQDATGLHAGTLASIATGPDQAVVHVHFDPGQASASLELAAFAGSDPTGVGIAISNAVLATFAMTTFASTLPAAGAPQGPTAPTPPPGLGGWAGHFVTGTGLIHAETTTGQDILYGDETTNNTYVIDKANLADAHATGGIQLDIADFYGANGDGSGSGVGHQDYLALTGFSADAALTLQAMTPVGQGAYLFYEISDQGRHYDFTVYSQNGAALAAGYDYHLG